MAKDDEPGKPPVGQDSKKFDRLELNYPPPSFARRTRRGLSLGDSGPASGPVVAQQHPPPAKGPAEQKLEDRANFHRANLAEEQAKTRAGIQKDHDRQRKEQQARLDSKYGPRPQPERSGREESGITWHGMGRQALSRIFSGFRGRESDARPDAPQDRPDGPLDPRRAEEQELDSRLSEEFQGIEDQLQATSLALENLIQQANDRGYFLEDCPGEASHDQGLHSERGNDEGGRERE